MCVLCGSKVTRAYTHTQTRRHAQTRLPAVVCDLHKKSASKATYFTRVPIGQEPICANFHLGRQSVNLNVNISIIERRNHQSCVRNDPCWHISGIKRSSLPKWYCCNSSLIIPTEIVQNWALLNQWITVAKYCICKSPDDCNQGAGTIIQIA